MVWYWTPATQVTARIGFQWPTACHSNSMQLQHAQSVPGENTTQKIGKEPVGTPSSKGRAFVTEARRFERKPQEDFFEDVEILEQKQSLAGIACIAAICLVYPVLVQSCSAARCCLQRHCHCPAYRPRRKRSGEQSPERRPLSVRRSAAAKVGKNALPATFSQL